MWQYVHDGDGSWKTHPYINIYIYIHRLKPSWPKAQCPNAIERDPICHLANTVAFSLAKITGKDHLSLIWPNSMDNPTFLKRNQKKHDFDFAPLGNRTILKYNSHTYSILAVKDFYLLLANPLSTTCWLDFHPMFSFCDSGFIDLIHHKGCRAFFINLWLHLWVIWYPQFMHPLEARVCVNTEKSIGLQVRRNMPRGSMNGIFTYILYLPTFGWMYR